MYISDFCQTTLLITKRKRNSNGAVFLAVHQAGAFEVRSNKQATLADHDHGSDLRYKTMNAY